MASTRDLMVIANTDGFQKRVKYNMQAIAIYTMGAVKDIPELSVRIPYCKSVLLGAASVYEMAIAVLTDTDVKAVASADGTEGDLFGIADGTVNSVVNAMFGNFAGLVS